jgi:hypothetical protein
MWRELWYPLLVIRSGTAADRPDRYRAGVTSPPPDGQPYGEAVPPQVAPGRSPWLIVIIAVLVLFLVAVGIGVTMNLASGGSPSASPSTGGAGGSSSPSLDSTPTASPSPSPKAIPSGPRYHADTDLCAKIPTAPLGNWVAKKPKNGVLPYKGETGVPDSYTVECDVIADSSPPGFWCEIAVSVQIYETTSAARASYAAKFAVEKGEPVHSMNGYGEVAYGRYLTDGSELYQKTSGYRIVVQKENLLLYAVVSLIHDDDIGFIPEQTVLARVGPEVKAIILVVPKS